MAARQVPEVRMLRWIGSWLLWCGLLMGMGCAEAHPMPESRVWVDATEHGLMLTLQLPLDRLEIAYRTPLAAEPDAAVARESEGLMRYLLAHVAARSGVVPWQVSQPSLKVDGRAPHAELVATMALRAPAGADPRSATLLLDVISHEIRTHKVLVFLRNDWAAGHVAQAPVLLGEIRYETNQVNIALPQAATPSNWLVLWQAGLTHIAEGTDHLLFLILLVVVAPLGIQAQRWVMVRPPRQAVRQVMVVVTAFTLGHFVTLALGSAGVLVVSAQYVEVAVAATIALAALHALWPLWWRSDVWMALGFGLIHGMAFSATLSGGGLTPWQHAQALLAFNLGIETMQLLVLLALMPPLLVIVRFRPHGYAWLRMGLGVLALVASVQWMLERMGWSRWGESTWVDDAAADAPWLVAGLWLLAMVVALGWRVSPWPCRRPNLR
jgi:hypothetical protein